MKIKRQAHGSYETDSYGAYYLLPLTQGFEAKISPEDLERVCAFNWAASRESRDTKVYAIRWVYREGVQHKVRLHRFVMDLPPGTVRPDVVVDHIDDDGLDCRRTRLQIITQTENMAKCTRWKKKGEPFL